jgi:hypothetical protein
VIALKKITNQLAALELLDIQKLARYMRCLFQISMSGELDVAEGIMSQVLNLASELFEV